MVRGHDRPRARREGATHPDRHARRRPLQPLRLGARGAQTLPVAARRPPRDDRRQRRPRRVARRGQLAPRPEPRPPARHRRGAAARRRHLHDLRAHPTAATQRCSPATASDRSRGSRKERRARTFNNSLQRRHFERSAPDRVETRRQDRADYRSTHGDKGYHRIKIETANSDAEIDHPTGYRRQ